MEDILVYDDIFSKEEVEKMRELLLYESPFVYGIADNRNQPPTGMTYEFTKPFAPVDIQLHKLANSLIHKIFEQTDKIKNKKIHTIRTNLFIPGENPYFHSDGDEFITCMYYMNPYFHPDEGGETQFLIGGEIKGILPKPGRLVIFDGSIIHRATSFRTQPRLTLVISFYK